MTTEEFNRAYAELPPERKKIIDTTIHLLLVEQMRKEQEKMGVHFNWFLLALAKAKGDGK